MAKNMREIRFMVGQCEASAGMRKYLQENFDEISALNPRFPFVVRAAVDVPNPRIIGMYDWGEEVTVEMSHLSEQAVEKQVENFVNFGAIMPRSGESDVVTAASIVDANWFESKDGRPVGNPMLRLRNGEVIYQVGDPRHNPDREIGRNPYNYVDGAYVFEGVTLSRKADNAVLGELSLVEGAKLIPNLLFN